MSAPQDYLAESLPTSAGSLSVVDRLVILLDAESALIEAGQTEGLADTTLAKSRMLLEINRLVTGQASSQAIPSQADLHGLKASLKRNQKALAAQLAAARSVSAIITQALRKEQSDTTYGKRSAIGISYGNAL